MKLIIEAKDVGLEIDLNEMRAAIRPTPMKSDIGFDGLPSRPNGVYILKDPGGSGKPFVAERKKPGRKKGFKLAKKDVPRETSISGNGETHL